jgi:dolichol-phosphate mannosyltransferase
MAEAVDFSIVIPVLDEEGSLVELHARLRAVLEALGGSYEIIFVDDGSTDRTVEILRSLHAGDPHVRAILLSRRFGHQRAVTSGLAYASGRATIVMDGDLQDPPEVIPQLVSAWREGYEVVYAVRRARPEGLLKRGAYRAFYRVLGRIANIDIPLDSGDFSLVDRRVLDVVNAMPERNRFVRGLRAWVGFRQTGVEYDREARQVGATKYPLHKLVTLALDGIVSHSYIPLRLMSQLGILISSSALLFLAYLVIGRLGGGDVPVGWTSLIVTVLFLGGLQLLGIGILGEYLARTLEEVKQRPHYVVRELLGFPARKDT